MQPNDELIAIPASLLRLILFGKPSPRNTPDHPEYNPSLDEDWYPKRWSDPKYLGDGPYRP